MTTQTESITIDIEAIHPARGAKFSPNLHAWLSVKDKTYRLQSRVYADQEGTLYIGLLDDGYLMGSRLNGVLCYGRKEASWAYGNLGKLTEVVGFWERYTAIGRCAIDPGHRMYFIGADARWKTSGDRRECLWCGNHSQKLRGRKD